MTSSATDICSSESSDSVSSVIERTRHVTTNNDDRQLTTGHPDTGQSRKSSSSWSDQYTNGLAILRHSSLIEPPSAAAAAMKRPRPSSLRAYEQNGVVGNYGNGCYDDDSSESSSDDGCVPNGDHGNDVEMMLMRQMEMDTSSTSSSSESSQM